MAPVKADGVFRIVELFGRKTLTLEEVHEPGQAKADGHENPEDPKSVQQPLAVGVFAGNPEYNRSDQGE